MDFGRDLPFARAARGVILVVVCGVVIGPVGGFPSIARGQSKPGKAVRTVPVLCRAAWGAKPPTRSYTRHRIKKITVHHTAVSLSDNRRAPRQIKAVQRYHQRKHRWVDIAYHYLVDRQGHLYQGRPAFAKGDTATRYDPTGHLLICLLGNYERQKPSKRQVEALAVLLRWAADRYGISQKAITGHRQHARTSCPGKNVQALLTNGTLQRRVSALGEHRLRLQRVCGKAAARTIRAIRRR
jgi:hypothetical protein